MRLHRFIGVFDLDAPSVAASDAALAHQLARVFRLRPGDRVVLCDGRGRQTEAEIVSLEKSTVTFRPVGQVTMCPAPKRTVTLYLAAIKRDAFELAVQKAVECGAAAVVPLLTRRTDRPALRHDRLLRIATEAAEQCGRGTVPVIAPITPFADALESARLRGITVFADFGGASVQAAVPAEAAEIGLFIGPEGGWETTEREQAIAAGATVVDLGPLALRAETAATIGTWLSANR